MKKSKVNPSQDVDAGDGLFTTVARKRNDVLCGFPGFWVPRQLSRHVDSKLAYAFALQDPWPKDMIAEVYYVTHASLANKINSATYKQRVNARLSFQFP